RCWIVNQKVITASTYRIGYYVNYIEYLDEDGLAFANKMAERFQPADAFVLDIGFTDEGWKIIEVNCINSAGFYASDLQKLLMALEEHFHANNH
ncbi:MAG: ATP-grasp domain-containing protein, partial [Saprospiraceae bacterium]